MRPVRWDGCVTASTAAGPRRAQLGQVQAPRRARGAVGLPPAEGLARHPRALGLRAHVAHRPAHRPLRRVADQAVSRRRVPEHHLGPVTVAPLHACTLGGLAVLTVLFGLYWAPVVNFVNRSLVQWGVGPETIAALGP